ncbi:Pathogenesis-related protein [Drosera capensis]
MPLHDLARNTVWKRQRCSRSRRLPASARSLSPSTCPSGWSGRFWGRTGCYFSSSGTGRCTTGDCGGVLHCTGTGQPPASLVENTLNGSGNQDFYDVSLVDGYNIGVSVAPKGGSGRCQWAGCRRNLIPSCPPELQMKDSRGEAVGCKSACLRSLWVAADLSFNEALTDFQSGMPGSV